MPTPNSSNIVLRSDVERPLLHGEMDLNFTEVKNVIDQSNQNKSDIAEHYVTTRSLLERSYAEVGIAIADGSFEQGVTEVTQGTGVYQESTGKVYQWQLTNTFNITAGTLPSNYGTVGVDWIDRTNDALRDEVRETVFQNMKRLAVEAGYNLVDGSFQIGAVTVNHNDVVWDWASGKYYGGVIGSVSGGSTPTGSWVDRTDSTLRSDLMSGSVVGVMTENDIGLKPIYKLHSYDNSDIYAAWLESVSLYGYVYLSGGSTTQYTLNGTHPDLYNSVVLSDPGVTLIVSDDQYPLLGSLKIKGDLIVKTTSINTKVQSSKIDKVSPVAKLKNNLLTLSIINFSDCYFSSVLGDVFTATSGGSSSASAILFPLTPGADTGIFCPITTGEAISSHLRVESGVATSVGVILRCTNGWVKIKGTIGVSGFTVSHKATGASEVQRGTIMGPDASLLSYAPGMAVIGVSMLTATSFNFLINGVGTTPIYSLVGDILEIGFIFGGVSGASVGRVTGLCCYKSDKYAYGYGPLNIAIYGDSTADEYAGSFDKYLPQLLDGENASRSLSIKNYAIAGQTFQQQFDLLQANGLGDNYIICMVAGTNDIQGGMTADTFAAKVTAFIDYCEAQGRVPMLVEPWMWYPNSMIGGDGQASSNYQNGSELREAGKRVALGRGAIYVSTTHELPAPLPSYFGTDIDPLLRDDIHQSQLGYRLYAELIASHIIAFMGRISKKGIEIPTLWKTSVVSSIMSSSISETGFSGSFQVSGFSNGAVILNLPRWCRPPRQLTVPAAFTVNAGALDSAYAVINTNGTVIVDGLTTTSTIIVISAQW